MVGVGGGRTVGQKTSWYCGVGWLKQLAEEYHVDEQHLFNQFLKIEVFWRSRAILSDTPVRRGASPPFLPCAAQRLVSRRCPFTHSTAASPPSLLPHTHLIVSLDVDELI